MTAEILTRRRDLTLSIIVALLLGGAALLGFVLLLPSASPHQTIQLSIIQDPATGAYVFSPATTNLPANSLVTIRIVNFDPSSHFVNRSYCNVTGTMDGMMSLMPSSGMMNSGRVSSVPSDRVSHTFTIVGQGYGVNIPIPPAASASTPAVVEFEMHTHGPESLVWACMATADAGSGPMGMQGEAAVR